MRGRGLITPSYSIRRALRKARGARGLRSGPAGRILFYNSRRHLRDRKGEGGSMASKEVFSVPGVFGGTDHYDEDGNLIGYSMPGPLGGTDHFNADGSPAGYSVGGVFAGTDHFDEEGRPAGYSVDGVLGGRSHFGADGRRVGYSVPSPLGGSTFRGDADEGHMGMYDDEGVTGPDD